MIKVFYTTAVAFALTAFSFSSQTEFSENKKLSSIYDYSCKDLNGDQFDFTALKGKRVLIVNTASKCGYTSQYEDLQKLYETYGGDKFIIVGFPANNFGKQEPGSNEEIASFCQKNYGVTFPMMEKSSVKGEDINELYSWLTQKDLNGVEDESVSWNFNKFLIDENGNWVTKYGSNVNPLDEKIVSFAKGK